MNEGNKEAKKIVYITQEEADNIATDIAAMDDVIAAGVRFFSSVSLCSNYNESQQFPCFNCPIVKATGACGMARPYSEDRTISPIAKLAAHYTDCLLKTQEVCVVRTKDESPPVISVEGVAYEDLLQLATELRSLLSLVDSFCQDAIADCNHPGLQNAVDAALEFADKLLGEE